jgi:hypothetical protein
MLTISANQRAMLSREVDARRARALADTIFRELCVQAAGTLKAYDKKKAHSIILDVINKCYARNIGNEDQILNICYIRFIINADVFTDAAFSYILDNNLLHPYAKARHLILSFFAINAMRGGA